MRKINLDHITKIEGHAKLVLKIEKNEIRQCDLSATEGSRYFEGIVRTRPAREAPEITSRICGICSCAHTVASAMAVENAFGISPTHQTTTLRNLLTLGERIRSHATHLYFLSLPDYLNASSALELAKTHRPDIDRALELMGIGNEIVTTIGGRDLHPVTCQVGGFLHFPEQEKIDKIEKQLPAMIKHANETIALFSSIPLPSFENPTEYFSLTHPDEYAMLSGIINASEKVYAQKNYRDYLKEYHEPRSTANFVVREGKSYTVGAISRIKNNGKHLHQKTKKSLANNSISFSGNSPLLNNLAQSAEIHHCLIDVQKILRKNTFQPEPLVEKTDPKGTGIAAIEVPRGTLWHEYSLNKKAEITNCNIITPTAQNLRTMEESIRLLVPSIMKLSKTKMILEIEKLIRSYDPCFSCSAHFLEVDLT